MYNETKLNGNIQGRSGKLSLDGTAFDFQNCAQVTTYSLKKQLTNDASRRLFKDFLRAWGGKR